MSQVPRRCGSGEDPWWLLDAQGIEVSRVFDGCLESIKSKYESWAFDGYTQSDCDEPIEGDDECRS